MHNSLHIRKLLREVNRNPIHRLRRDPHRTVARDPDAAPGNNEFLLADCWKIETALPSDIAQAIKEDLSDFLQRMGVDNTEQAPNTISVSLDNEMAARDCRLTFEPDSLRIEGGDISGLWAGVTWFEWEMRTRRGPILPRGVFEKRAAWGMQISQGPWGGNYSVPDFSPEYLSNDAFRLYAHYGVNSMMIYGDMLCYINSRILPELNCPDYDANIQMLKDASRRAARYGVHFTYVPVGPKLRPGHPVFRNHPDVRGAGVHRNSLLHFLCSSSPKVLAFYEETFENLFREVPELAGVIMITFSESFYHCRMWERITRIPCPSCAEIPVNQMVAGLVEAVNRGVKRGQAEAFTSMWVYSWPHGDRRNAFRELSPSIGVFHHIDKDHKYKKNGYTKSIWDYSIDYQGPTPAMVELADFAHTTQHPLFVKTETGIGLEVIQFPYVPAMQHLAGKWQNVRKLRPFGVHQSWLFFGMFGSRAEELGFWAAYLSSQPADNFIEMMAVRDFGPQAAPHVIAGWECMSRAVTHLPCLHLRYYYIGPSFLGPAHPLVPNDNEEVPDVFYAYLFYLQEGEETFSVKQIEQARTCLVMQTLPDSSKDVGIVPDDPDSDGWDLVAEEYAIAAREACQACNHLKTALPLTRTDVDKENLQEELFLTELLYRTFLSCEHTIRFLHARKRWEDKGLLKYHREMVETAKQERENALAALPIYRKAPWLDVKLRTDGNYSPCMDMIKVKVDWIDRFLAESNQIAEL